MRLRLCALALLLLAAPLSAAVPRVPRSSAKPPLKPPAAPPSQTRPLPPALGVPAVMAAFPAPHVRQETDYTCGPACLRGALLARGLDAPEEAELARELGTDPQDGTSPEALAEGARRRGLSARAAERLTLKGLLRALRRGRTPIVNIQSGGEGHWAILQGFEDGQALLMDPYEEASPSRVPVERFLESWWGVHAGRRYERAAVILGP